MFIKNKLNNLIFLLLGIFNLSSASNSYKSFDDWTDARQGTVRQQQLNQSETGGGGQRSNWRHSYRNNGRRNDPQRNWSENKEGNFRSKGKGKAGGKDAANKGKGKGIGNIANQADLDDVTTVPAFKASSSSSFIREEDRFGNEGSAACGSSDPFRPGAGSSGPSFTARGRSSSGLLRSEDSNEAGLLSGEQVSENYSWVKKHLLNKFFEIKEKGIMRSVLEQRILALQRIIDDLNRNNDGNEILIQAYSKEKYDIEIEVRKNNSCLKKMNVVDAIIDDLADKIKLIGESTGVEAFERVRQLKVQKLSLLIRLVNTIILNQTLAELADKIATYVHKYERHFRFESYTNLEDLFKSISNDIRSLLKPVVYKKPNFEIEKLVELATREKTALEELQKKAKQRVEEDSQCEWSILLEGDYLENLISEVDQRFKQVMQIKKLFDEIISPIKLDFDIEGFIQQRFAEVVGNQRARLVEIDDKEKGIRKFIARDFGFKNCTDQIDILGYLVSKGFTLDDPIATEQRKRKKEEYIADILNILFLKLFDGHSSQTIDLDLVKTKANKLFISDSTTSVDLEFCPRLAFKIAVDSLKIIGS